MASQMAKKMMERREKLAFGSLDAVSKPMPNAANYAADVSNTATKRPKCDTKTNAGNAGNAGNEDSAESIDNQSLVLSPVGPVPKILGPHNKQELCCSMLQLWFCMSFACHVHVVCMSYAGPDSVYMARLKTDHEAHTSRWQIIKIYQDVVLHDASRLHDFPQYVVSLGSWQDIQKFDIYTPRIEGIEISTPREDGEMPRRRTCPRTGRNQRALCMTWSSYVFTYFTVHSLCFYLVLSFHARYTEPHRIPMNFWMSDIWKTCSPL